LESKTKERDANMLSVKEIISRLGFWKAYLFSRWKTILLAGVIGGTIGLLYSILKKPEFSARCTFVLEEADKGGLGAFSGLASLAGIDLNGLGGSSGLFKGDNIIELYKSRSMIEKTLLSSAVFNGRPQLLIQRFAEFYKIDKKWRDVEPADLNFTIRPLTWKQDSIISEVVEEINQNYLTVGKPDKKLSIISVEYRSQDHFFSKVFTDEIVKNVNDFYTVTKTKKSAQNVAILERQADSVKRVLNNSIIGVAASGSANPNMNPALLMLKTPSQKRQVDVQASSAIYAEIVKNLELSKISLRRETPLIQIIDKPVFPLKKHKPRKSVSLLLGGIIAGFGTVLVLVWKKMYFE
jgi:hypothetical protein